MTGSITRSRDVESLKLAASWPGAERATIVTLATRLASDGAHADGYSYFQREADAHPDQALPLALAGFFQARLGNDLDAALAKLDKAAEADLGLPQYFRGLALAALPPDPQLAQQAVLDLQFVLSVRELFPEALLRAAHHGLATAYRVLGEEKLAAQASASSGLDSHLASSRSLFSSFWANAEDGFRFTAPRIWRPEPAVQVAQGYDFGDFAFISTSQGVIAIDAGTSGARVKEALAAADLPADAVISHLILTHSHFDHVGGAGAVRGPGTQVIAQGAFPAELARLRGAQVPWRYFTGSARPGGRDHPRHADHRPSHDEYRQHRTQALSHAWRRVR